MDRRRLIGEVAARHGIRLDEDDPALVLVTLTELMLLEAKEEFSESARRATADFLDAADGVQSRVGSGIAMAIRKEIADARKVLAADLRAANVRAGELVSQVHRAHEKPVRYMWVTVGLLAGLLMFLAGYAAGRWL